jgi:hypothetical protein
MRRTQREQIQSAMPIELTYRRFALMMDRRESQLICPARLGKNTEFKGWRRGKDRLRATANH